MARSAYVYLITEADTGLPVTAFTVKHELQTVLERIDASELEVWRIPDGRSYPHDSSRRPVQLDPVTLEPLEAT